MVRMLIGVLCVSVCFGGENPPRPKLKHHPAFEATGLVSVYPATDGKPGVQSSHCSCVYLGDGLWLTSIQLIDGLSWKQAGRMIVMLPGGEKLDAATIDRNEDFCLLETKSLDGKLHIVRLADEESTAFTCHGWTFGGPMSDPVLHHWSAWPNRKDPFFRRGLDLVGHRGARSGNSGGPVLNLNHELVGIIWGTADEMFVPARASTLGRSTMASDVRKIKHFLLPYRNRILSAIGRQSRQDLNQGD